MTKRLFSFTTSKELHHRGETISVHPNHRTLGELENSYELHAEVLINGEPIGGGMGLHDINYCLMDYEEDLLGKTYQLNVRIKRGDEIVRVSDTMEMECGTLLSVETQDTMALASGYDWISRLSRALALIHESYSKREDEDRIKLFGWEVGPYYFEFYWGGEQMGVKGIELDVSPTHNMDNITSFFIDSSSILSVSRSFNEIFYHEVKAWMVHPAFRIMMVEQPIGNDLIHHYQFLVAIIAADSPALSLPMGLRTLSRVASEESRKIGVTNGYQAG
ncbi:hypothetical protein [Vibrio phage phiKT1028]|nr:hypothetical protein [Vibrio phage phiKT1028]